MSNTNKKFSLNKYLVWTMKNCGKQKSKQIWKSILEKRKNSWSWSWQDRCNGKTVVNDCIYEYGIVDEWCIVD